MVKVILKSAIAVFSQLGLYPYSHSILKDSNCLHESLKTFGSELRYSCHTSKPFIVRYGYNKQS